LELEMGHNQAEELENLVKWRSKMKKAYIRTANYDLEKVFKRWFSHFSKKL